MRSLAAALGTGPMTVYNYVADKEGLEELVVAAVVAEVRLPDPTDDWQQDAYAIADAMWRGVRAHPAAISLVLTRRTLSATGFAAADALIAALERAGLADRDRLAAFHAVLGFVVGAAQAELAGPLTRGSDAADAAARIGSVARRDISAHRGAFEGSDADDSRRRLRPRAAHAARRHRDPSTARRRR